MSNKVRLIQEDNTSGEITTKVVTISELPTGNVIGIEVVGERPSKSTTKVGEKKTKTEADIVAEVVKETKEDAPAADTKVLDARKKQIQGFISEGKLKSTDVPAVVNKVTKGETEQLKKCSDKQLKKVVKYIANM